jgi:hypothetical protein
VADGVNLPAGPGLGRLVEMARASRAASARHSSPFVVTVSSDLSAAARERLKELDVDRAVVFVTPPFGGHVRGQPPARADDASSRVPNFGIRSLERGTPLQNHALRQ